MSEIKLRSVPALKKEIIRLALAAAVQLLFALPLAGPYTVTVEPLRGGARQTLTQDDLPGDCLPLTGPNAKYTVAADLQGEDDAVYHAQYVFIFRKEAS